MRNTVVICLIGVAILGVGWWYISSSSDNADTDVTETKAIPQVEESDTEEMNANQGAAIGEENLVVFQCASDKSITAVFERDIVGLTLSDGRQIVLRHAASGSGIRYLSNDTKIELRGEGNEAQLIEDGRTTYTSCVASI